jgi:hypothetical protein
MNSNQINKNLCVELLVEYNYNYDDAVKIVDMVTNFENNYSSITTTFDSINNAELLSEVMESDLLEFLLDENSTYQNLSTAYKCAQGITKTYGMAASLSDINESNKNGLPADHDSLGGFLEDFLDTVNLLSGEVTGIDALTDEMIDKINNIDDTVSDATTVNFFGTIYLSLSEEFKRKHLDIEAKLGDIMYFGKLEGKIDVSHGLSLEQLDILIEYFKEKYKDAETPDFMINGLNSYEEFMFAIEEYTEDRIVYELNESIANAGLTPEQLQKETNELNNALRTANFNREINNLKDWFSGLISTINPFDNEASDPESERSGGSRSGTRLPLPDEYNTLKDELSSDKSERDKLFDLMEEALKKSLGVNETSANLYRLLDLREMLTSALSDTLSNTAQTFTEAQKAVVVVDPLILDLDGDGFDITTKKDGTYFDLNSDGFAEKINWTREDGILAIDKNGNGTIDNGAEVFGDYHIMSDGTRAENGFTALAQYDSNADGVINADDEIFGDLRVWIDADGDGFTDAGELKTLSDHNISSINLNSTNINKITDTEATIGSVSSFTQNIDGVSKTKSIGEIWVSSNLYDTVEMAVTNVSDEVNGLPDVRSFGKISSLHNAISRDETGALKSLVENFTTETDQNIRFEIVEQILHFMCNTSEIAKNSRGSSINAKDLKVVEAFMGQAFSGVNGVNPNSTAAPMLNNVYKELTEIYYFSMLGSSVDKHMQFIISETDSEGKTKLNTDIFNAYMYISMSLGVMDEQTFSDIISYLSYHIKNIGGEFENLLSLREIMSINEEWAEIFENSVYGSIQGTVNGDSITGTTGSDLIFGKAGDDKINANSGDDYIYGGSGNDTITADYGNDIITGGTGNDIIDGGYGNDTYIFNLSDGKDIITDYDGSTGGNCAVCIVQRIRRLMPEKLYAIGVSQAVIYPAFGKVNSRFKVTLVCLVYIYLLPVLRFVVKGKVIYEMRTADKKIKAGSLR